MKNLEALNLKLRQRTNLKILANNPNKESAEEELDVDYSGQDLEIGFNINYVQESLNYLPGDDIEFVFFWLGKFLLS